MSVLQGIAMLVVIRSICYFLFLEQLLDWNTSSLCYPKSRAILWRKTFTMQLFTVIKYIWTYAALQFAHVAMILFLFHFLGDLETEIPSGNVVNSGTRHSDLSLQIPPRPIGFGSSCSGKGLLQSQDTMIGGTSSEGFLQALSLKKKFTECDGERLEYLFWHPSGLHQTCPLLFPHLFKQVYRMISLSPRIKVSL
ncbi:uncharacterized protein LOC127811046 isoform X3 [Diospyros lotus]|uniref:uncharacterized protein LOC127811046 isoform X3 n=1 Tax=Diospyros lotus TaxID=55363 RepID=UPI002257C093|nr:uncharacterized protein LOC127811046 isoform X3 [Diospyros lotus]XP_052206712.1 uncharacterized protein LOC127811046 isoform X3 [Diospyros lotus]